MSDWGGLVSEGAAGPKFLRAEAPDGHSQVHGCLQDWYRHDSTPTSPSTCGHRSESPEKPEGGSY